MTYSYQAVPGTKVPRRRAVLYIFRNEGLSVALDGDDDVDTLELGSSAAAWKVASTSVVVVAEMEEENSVESRAVGQAFCNCQVVLKKTS